MRKLDTKRIPMILSLALGALAGCGGAREEGTLAEEPAIQEEATDEGVLAAWDATLSPASMNSSMTGEASLQATAEGGTEIAIAVDSGDPGHTYPWHLHSGTCGSGGPIVGDGNAYAPVTTDEAGAGEAEATISINLDPEADYHVNVHASPELLEQIVACGEVRER